MNRLDIGVPGSYQFFGVPGPGFKDMGVAGMDYVCPCGCGTVGSLRFAVAGKVPRSPTHFWNGDTEEPTIVGTVAHMVAGIVCWHGVLVKGVWHEDPSGAADRSSDPPGHQGPEGVPAA